MSIIVVGVAVLLAVLVTIAWRVCGGRTIASVPMDKARSDGFRVLVMMKGTRGITSAKAQELSAVDLASQPSQQPTFLVPVDQRREIERFVGDAEGRTGDFSVSIIATPIQENQQSVTFSLHYGNRTMEYSYRIEGRRVIPLRQRRSDLGGTREVRYRELREPDGKDKGLGFDRPKEGKDLEGDAAILHAGSSETFSKV